MTTSPVQCEIDLEAEGKRSGFLRVPHSTHLSAYGWIPVPITVIANGAGPTVLMTAGVHGDEYEGQIALAKLGAALSASDIRGRLILMPAVNAPAAKAGLRVSPIDNANMNRIFPGDPAAGPSPVIAHYLETVLMPLGDVLVDLHSGGTSLMYPPTLLRGKGHTAEETRILRMLQDAFDLPYAWVFTSGGGRDSTARTAMGAGNRNGLVTIMAELGGGGGLCRDILARTERGLRRILHALGMMPEYRPDAMQGTRELHAQGSVYAYDSGLFEPYVDIGETVDSGAAVGQVHPQDSPFRAPVPVTSPHAGIVLCKRALGHVACGDAVFQIARDAD